MQAFASFGDTSSQFPNVPALRLSDDNSALAVLHYETFDRSLNAHVYLRNGITLCPLGNRIRVGSPGPLLEPYNIPVSMALSHGGSVLALAMCDMASQVQISVWDSIDWLPPEAPVIDGVDCQCYAQKKGELELELSDGGRVLVLANSGQARLLDDIVSELWRKENVTSGYCPRYRYTLIATLTLDNLYYIYVCISSNTHHRRKCATCALPAGNS
jgi:hypothetical protein